MCTTQREEQLQDNHVCMQVGTYPPCKVHMHTHTAPTKITLFPTVHIYKTITEALNSVQEI